jgi:negative regulator of sigma E activity
MSDHGMEKSLISAYCDGELNAIELAEAEQLLETSEEARAELQSYRNLTNLLQDNARPTFRVNLAASVLQAIQPQAVVAQSASATTVASGRSTSHDSTSPHFNTNRKSVRLWTVVAASAACLAMMVWVGLNRGGRPQLANHEQPQSTEKSVVTNSAASGFSAESSKTSEVTVARVEPQPKTGTTTAGQSVTSRANRRSEELKRRSNSEIHPPKQRWRHGLSFDGDGPEARYGFPGDDSVCSADFGCRRKAG